ncbi:MAG: HNH endonuclease, partial [Bacilli bacterium]|nr:HNH endonuclease [Bacilli bacterium]
FVIGNTENSDSYGGIMKIDEEQVQLMKRRGGVGIDLSHIRPKGSPVKNSALTSTGIVPFMERYSNSTKEVAQGGRRGALMISCSVHHINIMDFIDSKLEQGKITAANISVKVTDDFMKAVHSENGLFIHTHPIDLKLDFNDIDPNYELDVTYKGKKEGTYYKVSDAKKLWDKIILNAWKSAEPGVLFWDTIINESVPDCYPEHGFKTISTNPCLVGDTMVAVADGRGDVSIKQLADEGNDVPVYCFDDNNNIVIRTMRNPRVTGYGENIYKITLDSGDVIRCTGNHKFLNTDSIYVRADNMKIGESLNITTRSKTSIISSDDKSKKYWALFSNNKKFFEHRMIASHYNNRIIESGYVVHHKDRNASNNNPDNLEIMKTSEHNKLHGEDMKGELNPIFGIINDEKRFAEYSKNMSEAVSGEGNGRFLSNITNDMIIENLCKYCISQKQPLSKNDIIKVLNGLGISSLTKFRQKELGSYTELSKKICEMVGMAILFDGYDTRLRKRAYQALDNGYEVNIENNKVLVKKNCENCGEEFWAEYSQREISFCSSKCSIIKYNKSDLHKKQVSESNKSKFEEVDNKRKQVYTKLKFDLGRKPSKKEWIEECVNNNISVDFRSEYSTYKTFEDFESEALMFNHRVISIELDGVENVYNGTVDEYHNFFVGGFDDESNKLYINNLNCGEIPLCPYDSCRLLALNLYSYVKNPFTTQAEFDFDLFKQHTKIAQKLMDDLVDLEIEKVDKILEKIASDPEPNHVKRTEQELWENIRRMGLLGRRTGLGITAEGDMLAALGMTYASDEAIEFVTKVHEILAISAYESSVDMAIDRGKFEIYDSSKEENSGFIQRIKATHPELYDRMIKHGRRNISLLTIAPNGSVSICTQTTSGIEPAFKVSYKRRRKINHNDNSSKRVFIDSEGQAWEEYNILHQKFAIWAEINGYDVNDIINNYT